MPRLPIAGMEPDDAEEYTQSLGQIVAGSWRQVALAQRLGVPQALGLSTEQWVHERLGGYVRLSVPDRREAVKELTADGLSQREAAEVLGVDQKTVSNDQRYEEKSSADASKRPETNGSDGDHEEHSSNAAAERQRAREAERAEENKRETLLRLTEAAYRGVLAWSVRDMAQEFIDRCADTDFRRQAMQRLRLNGGAELDALNRGLTNLTMGIEAAIQREESK